MSEDPVRRQDLPSIQEPPGPVRHSFQTWLDTIDDELIAGANLVADALPRISRGFLGADRGCIAEAQVMTSAVGARCRQVEEQGFLLLAREAPVAGDLRRLVAILRLVTAVERSAALLRHVAETLDRLDPRRLPADLRLHLEELAGRSGEVFRHGVDAWRQRDGLAVTEVDRLDEAVDTLRNRVLERAEAELEEPAELVLLGLLARYYERIADHGVSFAQHATFAVTGERVEVGS
jgi:phosphate transport system protein